ncbi:MAG TPA: methyltransferase [Alphaproteobacteria bacterium]|nr:methyltransferase [Alphaproteobacteria bacterium]HAJ46368.1 methyltransferase [Alphaproteobacteria bacterium]
MTNSLRDPKVAATLKRLHARATADWLVFLRALPAVLWGWLRGRSAMESAIPYLKNAYIPINAEQGQVLYALARAAQAKTIVEFGTSFGISAIYLAAAARDCGGRFTGTELEPNKVKTARENLATAGLDAVATVLAGDARETLKEIAGPIDFVLLDGWKEMCLPILKQLEPQLRPGAVVLCDDIKAFAKTLAPYLAYVREDGGPYVSQLLPLGDGLEFSVYLGASEVRS